MHLQEKWPGNQIWKCQIPESKVLPDNHIDQINSCIIHLKQPNAQETQNNAINYFYHQ